MNSENEEAVFLKDRRFIVGEREILQLIKKSVCEQCSEIIDEHTIQEGEKIAAGIKFKYKCKVSINAIENTMLYKKKRAFYVKLYSFVIFSMCRNVFKTNTVQSILILCILG